jgi:glutamate-1-semialdehyde 2,1-aminomutase
VSSNVRLDAPPVFFARGAGAWLWDVNDRNYVDYLLGQGPNFLGHGNEIVTRAVAEACRAGTIYGAQHPLEVEAAERFCAAVGWPEMVRMGLTGTEMVQVALRLARAATGRRRFVRFEGHYHGWLDNVLIAVRDGQPIPASAGQVVEHLQDCRLLPWNDADALASLLAEQGDDIAAVLMEPVMLNTGSVEPRPGYLEEVRRLCSDHRVVLIFDEVITGFRLALGGAAERYGVTPDLAVYGKAMAGGWPVAAIAGRADLMERLGTGEVNHSGTFNGSVMAAAAVIASINLLTEDPPYERIARHGEALGAGLVRIAAEHALPLRVQGPPAAFHASFADGRSYARLANCLASHGVWVARRGVWYVSAAHGPDELEAALERAVAAMRDLGGS